MTKEYDLLIEWKKLLLRLKREYHPNIYGAVQSSENHYYNEGLKTQLKVCISEFFGVLGPNSEKIADDLLVEWKEFLVEIKKEQTTNLHDKSVGMNSHYYSDGSIDQLEICILQFVNLLKPIKFKRK